MDFVEQLKSSVDIVSVVGEYVRLRRSGANRYMGLCPFHNEKSPSFTVHVVHQFYKCFSCGAAGDVFKFVMEKEGLSFYEALKSLAERYGIPMPKRSQYADEDSKLRGALLAMHEQAQETFRANLKSQAGEAARATSPNAASRRRPWSSSASATRTAPDARWCGSSSSADFPWRRWSNPAWWASAQDGSLYDRFRNRLMFPIHNEIGQDHRRSAAARCPPEDEPEVPEFAGNADL